MTPRLSIIGSIARFRFLARFRFRALIFGGLTALFLLLSFFPQRYLATSSFTPTDRDSIGLSGTLGQLGALNSVFGNQAAVEVALRVGNSDAVRDDVIKKAELADKMPGKSRVALQRFLKEKVSVRSLRGGIILVEMQSRDADLAVEIVDAYQHAVKEELGRVSRRQTAYKREVLMQLVGDSAKQLASAQEAYDAFRLSNRYAEPKTAMIALEARIPYLEAGIRERRVALAKARETYADQNFTIKQMSAELAELEGQLSAAKSITPDSKQSVGELVENSSKLYRLERELEVAKSLHDGYIRYLRGTAVEDLTSNANLRVLEPAHVEAERQIFLKALALAIATFLLWMAIEAYRLRPPRGAGIRSEVNA